MEPYLLQHQSDCEKILRKGPFCTCQPQKSALPPVAPVATQLGRIEAALDLLLQSHAAFEKRQDQDREAISSWISGTELALKTHISGVAYVKGQMEAKSPCVKKRKKGK